MSDTEMPNSVKEAVDNIVETTKKGFDLRGRLKNRGLRKGSITLYLDEEKGAEIGWAQDVTDALGNVVRRDRVGILGELDSLREAREAASALTAPAGSAKAIKEIDAKIAAAQAKYDELLAELKSTSITISMRAVPPVIQKDCRRLARQTLGIEEKSVPESMNEEFIISHTGHLMTKMFQTITDNETGAVNTQTDYEDAMALMDELPPGQYTRLDLMMGKIQFTDAISREIEAQEDFS